MRLVFSLLSPRVSKRCHEMASPSRSASDASQTMDAFCASFFRSATTFFLSAGMTYFGMNPLSISMLNPFSSRSRMCPMLALTTKSLPNASCSFLIFPGDSTITRFLPIPSDFTVFTLFYRQAEFRLISVPTARENHCIRPNPVPSVIKMSENRPDALSGLLPITKRLCKVRHKPGNFPNFVANFVKFVISFAADLFWRGAKRCDRQ